MQYQVPPTYKRLQEHRSTARARYLKAKRAEQEASRLERGVKIADRQKVAVEARDDLLKYIHFTMPDPEDISDTARSRYKDAKHHRKIARALEEVERGNIPFLILVTAPRHGKSELVSRRLPAWYAGRHPDHDIVVSTYSDEFAMDFGADVRAILNSPQHHQVFPGFKLRRGGTAKDRLQTDKGGLLAFVGRGGALTGRGAHLLIVDDIIKDDKEASSQAIRDQAWNWLTKVALTRRRGKKLVIMTFTRWHTDDPIGRLTNSNTDENPYFNEMLAKRIKIIELPAIAEANDTLGRAPGEPLWPDGPDKFDLDFLEEQRALMGPLNFEALYQGRPTLDQGILFRRENMHLYNPADLPKELRYYCASDHAVGLKQRHDFTVLLKVGVDQNEDIWLTECFWQKVPTDQVVEAILTMASGATRPIVWWAEKDHIGKSIGPFLRKRIAETGKYLNMIEVPSAADKQQRAQSIVARVNTGKLHLPAWAGWTSRAIDQMLGFPNATHDDFVDALSLIGTGLQRQYGPQRNTRAKIQPVAGSLAFLQKHDKWVKEERAAAAARLY
jgi:predicted phage terminase large subunit-like protein